MGADKAWARLDLQYGVGTAPGSGQTVGLIDTEIDPDHPVFAGKEVFRPRTSGEFDLDQGGVSHGTAVASLIVGRPSEAYTAETGAARGVAWGADVAMFDLPPDETAAQSPRPRNGAAPGVKIPTENLGKEADYWNAVFRDVIEWSQDGRSVDFVNMSVGSYGIIEQYEEQVLRDHFADVIATLAQAETEDKAVFVVAAGNDRLKPCEVELFPDHPDLCVNGKLIGRSVGFLAGLQVRIPELRAHMIAVAALVSGSNGFSGRIAGYSNRCGIAADWCIAAPGHGTTAAHSGGGKRTIGQSDGTSSAAPMVTGALVVMKHYFRDQLSNTALAARLLETANQQGVYADRETYGRGRLDLDAATSPVGATSMALGKEVDGPARNVAQTYLALGGAWGNGLTRELAGQEVAAFDALGAPFWFSLDNFVQSASATSAAEHLRTFMVPGRSVRNASAAGLVAFSAGDGTEDGGGLRLGLMAPATPGVGHLSLAGGALALRTADRAGLTLAAFTSEGMHEQAPASGVALSWNPSKGPLVLRGGWVAERKTLLGSTASGAFGGASAHSVFAGIEGSVQLGGWQLGAEVEIGTTRTAIRGAGLLADVSPLTTSAFAVQVERPLAKGDTLSFSITQPLRVEAGHARLSIPTGRTKDGQVTRWSGLAELEPAGRQIDLAAQWQHSFAPDREMRLGMRWVWQPGHDTGAASGFILLASYRHRF